MSSKTSFNLSIILTFVNADILLYLVIHAYTQLTNLRGYHVAATWRYRGYHVEGVTSKRRDFVESWLRRRHVFRHVYTTL